MSFRWHVVAVVVILACAGCSEPLDEQHPSGDMASTPPLLLPWAELSGRIAYLDSAGALHVADAHQRRIIRIVAPTPPNFVAENAPIVFSGDGGRVAVMWSDGSEAETRVFDTRTGVLVQTIAGRCVNWLADGRLSYFVGYTLQFNGVDQVQLSPFYECPAVAPDGRSVAYSKATMAGTPPIVQPVTTLQRVDLVTGSELRISGDNTQLLYFLPAISPNSEQIAFVESVGAQHYEIRLASPDRMVRPVFRSSEYLIGFAWSPDGRQLIMLRPSGAAILDIDGGRVREVLPGARLVGWGR